jgi:uncharacterized protein (TIGR03067 family)
LVRTGEQEWPITRHSRIADHDDSGKPLRAAFEVDSGHRDGNGCGRSNVTLDPTKEPKQMDVLDAVRKTPRKGICELTGDKLRAVFQPNGTGERPTEFATKKKGEVMITYERVKPK